MIAQARCWHQLQFPASSQASQSVGSENNNYLMLVESAEYRCFCRCRPLSIVAATTYYHIYLALSSSLLFNAFMQVSLVLLLLHKTCWK